MKNVINWLNPFQWLALCLLTGVCVISILQFRPSAVPERTWQIIPYDKVREYRLYDYQFIDVAHTMGLEVPLDQIHHEEWLDLSGKGRYRILFLNGEKTAAQLETEIGDGPVAVPEDAAATGYDRIRFKPLPCVIYNLIYVKPISTPEESCFADGFPWKPQKTALLNGEYFLRNDPQMITALKPFFAGLDDGRIMLELLNVSLGFDVILDELSSVKGKWSIPFPADTVIPFDLAYPTVSVSLPAGSRRIKGNELMIRYHYVGREEVFTQEVNAFRQRDDSLFDSTPLRIRSNIDLFSDLLEVKDGEIRFCEKSAVLKKLLIIPDGYHFVMDAEQQLQMEENAGIISYSPILVSGTEAAPVQITGGSVFVIDAAEKSDISFLHTENMTSAQYGALILKGGLNFCRSDLVIHDSILDSSSAGDFLTADHSSMEISDCSFSGGSGNGINAVASSVEIINSSFADISGSGILQDSGRLRAEDLSFVNVTAAGIHVRDNAAASLSGIAVSGARTAIRITDGACCEADMITVSDSTIGVCLYRNDPSYSHAEAHITELKIRNPYQFEYLLQNDDMLEIDGEFRQPLQKKKQYLIFENLIQEGR